MSTKISIFYNEAMKDTVILKPSIHLYYEMMDNSIYVESYGSEIESENIFLRLCSFDEFTRDVGKYYNIDIVDIIRKRKNLTSEKIK